MGRCVQEQEGKNETQSREIDGTVIRGVNSHHLKGKGSIWRMLARLW